MTCLLHLPLPGTPFTVVLRICPLCSTMHSSNQSGVQSLRPVTLSSPIQKQPAQSLSLTMMDAATPSIDRRSDSPMTATNTFAATARDDPAGLIGMGNTTMASSCLVDEVCTLGSPVEWRVGGTVRADNTQPNPTQPDGANIHCKRKQ